MNKTCLFCDKEISEEGCCKDCLEVLKDPNFSSSLIRNHLLSKLKGKIPPYILENMIKNFLNLFPKSNSIDK